MNKKREFDIIIIGAGLSGLTLAVELVNRTKKSILILEKKKGLNLTKIGVFGVIQITDFPIVLIIPGIKLP